MRSAFLVVIAATLGLAGAARAQGGPDASDQPSAAATESGGGLDRLQALGGYEREALARALLRRRLEVDLAPAGKRLGRIHVVNQEVFSEGDGLTWLNLFHRTTRERVIEREVLLRPGQRWDETVIADSLRRLRDPTYTALVVMVPVRAPTPGEVDLLVVTRDIWSLRFNTSYEIQNGSLTKLLVAPSESNFLGMRKQVALLFDLDQGDYSVGGYYVDSNIAGSRMRLRALSTAVFGREDSDFEGSRTRTTLTYPLWSLRRPWGAEVSLVHIDHVERDFQGTALRLRDLPSTPDVMEQVPHIFGLRTTSLDSVATLSFGSSVKQYLGLGYELSLDRPSLHPDAPTPAQCAGTPLDACVEAFRRDVMPRSERASAVYAQYSLFTPSFRTLRNVDTYDLPEERQFGPDVQVLAALARTEIGSEANFVRLSARLGWTVGVGEHGFVRAVAAAESRWQDGAFIDNELSAALFAVSPPLGPGLRLAGRAEVAALVDETANRYFTLGGANGLRGHIVGEYSGESRVRANLELRSPPVRFWFSRVGLNLFWDLGHAADRLRDLEVQHDVGVGGRMVMPQVQTVAFRFDWAVPLTGSRAGFPGRIILGFEQAFDVLGSSPVPDTPL
ncbi:hypothetical protein [Haliangium sp.]|uniref:hypothetical protein n=1 Tax=Haliangium sp. TaxID=2663208 RepID=UPI003D0C9139